jgi:hypothetical protein
MCLAGNVAAPTLRRDRAVELNGLREKFQQRLPTGGEASFASTAIKFFLSVHRRTLFFVRRWLRLMTDE